MILYAATSNPGKLREIADRLASRVDLRPPPPTLVSPEESGTTYVENARIKARALCDATGKAALADDSGLEVDALGGRPGIASARYGDDDEGRIERLLCELSGAKIRTARFRCVLVLLRPEGREMVAEGVCDGTIARQPRGAGGFGYDPVFVPEGEERSFAELSPGEKGAISHRGRALDRLCALLDAER